MVIRTNNSGTRQIAPYGDLTGRLAEDRNDVYSISAEEIRRRRLVILGGGESGVGAAILAQKKGFDVFLSDLSAIKPQYKSMLDENGIKYEENQHTEDRILTANEVIKSPGIPNNAPIIQKIIAKNIPIISEIEFAGRYTDAKMICITGSNGKTTTTMLTYHILKSAGLNVGLAGNVGNSLALQVAIPPLGGEGVDYYVIELSSFQLDEMFDFKADIAILTNITPDHLDRYDYDFQKYVNAKFRITQNQTAEDAFIYWKNDPVVTTALQTMTIQATQYSYDENHVWQLPSTLPGTHNALNAAAAATVAQILSIFDEKIQDALLTFEGVPHRMEYVATINGVQYVNDSKATNVDSCRYALMGTDAPIVLILGGTDKGNDYSEIEQLVKNKVRAIVCMGVDNTKLTDYFTGKISAIYDTHSLTDAIAACRRVAQEGDTVLLSPCCASFDLFKNYEERGELFKTEIKKMIE